MKIMFVYQFGVCINKSVGEDLSLLLEFYSPKLIEQLQRTAFNAYAGALSCGIFWYCSSYSHELLI